MVPRTSYGSSVATRESGLVVGRDGKVIQGDRVGESSANGVIASDCRAMRGVRGHVGVKSSRKI